MVIAVVMLAWPVGNLVALYLAPTTCTPDALFDATARPAACQAPDLDPNGNQVERVR